MKKLLAAFPAVATLGLTAAQATEALTVMTAPVSRAEVLNVVEPLLAKKGVEPKARELIDYVQLNVRVSEKRLDANFFQHQPYLDEFNKARGTDPVAVTGVHIEPLSVYSSKHRKLDELPSGTTVATSDGATNGGRALLLLDKAGVIKLRGNKNITATPKDIVDNPKSIKIRELETVTLPRVLTQVGMALINTNYALEVRLNSAENALAIEGSDSPYVNILVVRPDNEDSDAIQKLTKVLHSTEVKQFTQEEYKGVVVPAF